MDTRPFIVTFCADRPKAPWKMEIRRHFAGKKIRRFRATEAEAYDIGDELTGQIREKGVSSLVVSGTSVAAGIKHYWAMEGATIKSKSHRGHLERVFRLFEAKHGRDAAKAIGPTELVEFWNRPEWPDGKSTRWQAFVYLRILFNFLERYDLVDKNPIRRVKPPTEPAPLQGIITPERMGEYLEHLKRDWQQAWLALSGFASLRTSEVLRVDPKRDLNWKSEEIRVVGIDDDGEPVRDGHAPGERYVKMCPAFIRHCPKTFRMPNTRNFYKIIEWDLAKAGQPKPPQNALRHSWFTYYLAMSKNAAETAHQGGNSEKITKDTYALPAARANWEAWWEL